MILCWGSARLWQCVALHATEYCPSRSTIALPTRNPVPIACASSVQVNVGDEPCLGTSCILAARDEARTPKFAQTAGARHVPFFLLINTFTQLAPKQHSAEAHRCARSCCRHDDVAHPSEATGVHQRIELTCLPSSLGSKACARMHLANRSGTLVLATARLKV